MALKAFARIDGLTGIAARAVLDCLNVLVDAVNAASKDRPVSALTTGVYVARYDDMARVSAGGSLSLPPANASSASKRVGLFVVGAGSVRVTAQAATLPGGLRQGTVNGASFDSVLGPGYAEFVSDGAGAWSSTSSSESGAAAASAAESDDLQGLASVLEENPHSGAFSAFMDANQFINFGLPGPSTSSPQLRSGDATFRVRGSGVVSVGGVTGASFFATGAAATVAVSSDAGPVSLDAFQGLTITTGALVPRVAIDASGAWKLNNVAGAATQVATSQGPGLPVIWAPAGAGAGATVHDATVVLPFSGLQSDTVNVVDASILAGSKLQVTWGTVLDSDENGPDMYAVSFSAVPAAGSMTLKISASCETPFETLGGSYKVRYLIG